MLFFCHLKETEADGYSSADRPPGSKKKGYDSMIHLYCGEGKGKTTAAMGLALRALGHGRKVVIVQFLKNGKSGELTPLKTLGAAVFSGKSGTGFVSEMSAEEKRETRFLNDRNLESALNIPCDLLILDEACAACRLGMVDEERLSEFVKNHADRPEIVLTGRDPVPWMIRAADYITRMQAERHPYDRGISARKGIEF